MGSRNYFGTAKMTQLDRRHSRIDPAGQGQTLHTSLNHLIDDGQHAGRDGQSRSFRRLASLGS